MLYHTLDHNANEAVEIYLYQCIDPERENVGDLIDEFVYDHLFFQEYFSPKSVDYEYEEEVGMKEDYETTSQEARLHYWSAIEKIAKSERKYLFTDLMIYEETIGDKFLRVGALVVCFILFLLSALLMRASDVNDTTPEEFK